MWAWYICQGIVTYGIQKIPPSGTFLEHMLSVLYSTHTTRDVTPPIILPSKWSKLFITQERYDRLNILIQRNREGLKIGRNISSYIQVALRRNHNNLGWYILDPQTPKRQRQLLTLFHLAASGIHSVVTWSTYARGQIAGASRIPRDPF